MPSCESNRQARVQTIGSTTDPTGKISANPIVRPDDAIGHCNLGTELKAKGELDGAIAEYRAALRLQPANAEAHYDLGRLLSTKGDREAAFEEFHTAHWLAPNEPAIRQVYYNLMRQLER
jgi:Flp pilus assembly protein TadD